MTDFPALHGFGPFIKTKAKSQTCAVKTIIKYKPCDFTKEMNTKETSKAERLRF